MKSYLCVLLLAVTLPACAKNKKHQAAPETEFSTIYQVDADASSGGKAIESDCSSCDESWERGMALYPAAYEEAGAPEGTDALSLQLRGRHAETVPRGAELTERANAEAQLQHLVEHGALLVERTRALSLLRHFPSDDTRALLLNAAADEAALLPIRSAALRSLQVIAKPDDTEVQNVLEMARRSPEPRIRASVKDVEE